MQFQEKEGVIQFNTKPNTEYVIISKGNKPFQQHLFKGKQNNGPKQFLEAILGKHKNF